MLQSYEKIYARSREMASLGLLKDKFKWIFLQNIHLDILTI